jgi:hypothetical protein
MPRNEAPPALFTYVSRNVDIASCSSTSFHFPNEQERKKSAIPVSALTCELTITNATDVRTLANSETIQRPGILEGNIGIPLRPMRLTEEFEIDTIHAGIPFSGV